MFNAQTKNITIETEIASGLMIYADEEMIKLVLRNLVANAIKFCRKNDSINIRASVENSMAKMEVKDTGMGIAEKDLPRLFGMMHLSTKGTRDEIGTGLGLALCKEFVEKNGGRISVKSQLGKGSVFEFTVPLSLPKQVQVS
jgi:two-component system, sensor histidine kinase and response regulator